MEITFEQLPLAVSRLSEKLDTIEQLLLSQSKEIKPAEEKLLTIREAAEMLHLTVPTIYGLVQRAEIPVCKRGKRLYFSKLELTSWIKDGRKKTTAETEQNTEIYIQSTRKGRRI